MLNNQRERVSNTKIAWREGRLREKTKCERNIKRRFAHNDEQTSSHKTFNELDLSNEKKEETIRIRIDEILRDHPYYTAQKVADALGIDYAKHRKYIRNEFCRFFGEKHHRLPDGKLVLCARSNHER